MMTKNRVHLRRRSNSRENKLEEPLLHEREETRNMMRGITEQINRLQKVQVEQQGTFLPPGPVAAAPPPLSAYHHMPYNPQGPQSYHPAGGPQSYPPVGRTGQYPYGHPVTGTNIYIYK